LNSVDDDGDRQTFDAAAFRRAVGASQTVRDYAPRRTIFMQGDAADAVFYVQHGQVKLSLCSPQGKDAVIAIVGAGHFFGESCLRGDLVRLSTATAITPSSVVRIERTVMLRILRDEPKISRMFIAHLLARNIRIEEDLVDQLFNSAEKRLARTLLLLSNFDDGAAVAIKIDQATLGEMIGTTRSRVSFFLTRFRRLGYIENKNGIQVKSTLLDVILRD
jgi:CRP/FNR family cyclic AMP-dependent transcriptional regulator